MPNIFVFALLLYICTIILQIYYMFTKVIVAYTLFHLLDQVLVTTIFWHYVLKKKTSITLDFLTDSLQHEIQEFT